MVLYNHRYRIESPRLSQWDYASPGYYFITVCTKHKTSFFGYTKNDGLHYSPVGAMAWQCWLTIPDHFPNVGLDAFVVMPNHMHGILVLKEPDDRSAEVARVPPQSPGSADVARVPPPYGRVDDVDDVVRVDGVAHVDRAGHVAGVDHVDHVDRVDRAGHVAGVDHVDRVDHVETQYIASLQRAWENEPNKFGPLKTGSLPQIIRTYKAAVTRWCNGHGHDYFAWQPRYYESVIRDEYALRCIRRYIVDNPKKWVDKYRGREAGPEAAM